MAILLPHPFPSTPATIIARQWQISRFYDKMRFAIFFALSSFKTLLIYACFKGWGLLYPRLLPWDRKNYRALFNISPLPIKLEHSFTSNEKKAPLKNISEKNHCKFLSKISKDYELGLGYKSSIPPLIRHRLYVSLFWILETAELAVHKHSYYFVELKEVGVNWGQMIHLLPSFPLAHDILSLMRQFCI